MSKLKILLIILNFLLLSSCIHYQYQPAKNDSNFTPHSKAPLIKYPKQKQKFKLIKTEDKCDFQIKTYQCKNSYYTLPQGNTPHTLTIEIYEPKKFKNPTPVLVLPISGGEYFFARYFSREFARNGMQAVFVHRQKKYLKFKDLKQIDPNLRQLIIDHRLVIDWLETQANLNFKDLSCFGISLGGIKTILISGNDPRVKNTVAYLAGSDLPYIMTYSNEKGVVKRRKHLQEKYNLNLEELHEELKIHTTIDPQLYAQNIDPSKTFILTAKWDKAVPTQQA